MDNTMKQDEAVRIINSIMIATQRVRSAVLESLGPVPERPQTLEGWAAKADRDFNAERGADGNPKMYLTEETLASAHPHVFGNTNLVEVAMRLLDNYDKRGWVAPMDLYNIVRLAQSDILIKMWFASQGWDLPDADLAWIEGWEKTDDLGRRGGGRG